MFSNSFEIITLSLIKTGRFFFLHQKCSVQHRLLNVLLDVTVIDMKLKIHCWIFSNDIVLFQVYYNLLRISISELFGIILKVNARYN